MSVVSTFSTSFTSGTSPRTMEVTTQVGDLVVVMAGAENNDGTINTPSGNGITFTLRQSIVQSNFGTAYIWTGVDNTGGSDWILSLSSPETVYWGATALVARNSGGVGASGNVFDSTIPQTLSITTTATDSTIAVFSTDWNAADGSSRTWATVNGITPTAGNLLEIAYGFDSLRYTAYSAYYPETGAPGVKAVGVTSPGGQRYAIVALEILPGSPATTATIAWLSA